MEPASASVRGCYDTRVYETAETAFVMTGFT